MLAQDSGSADRQSERKAGAFAPSAAHPDAAAQALDDALADMQPETRALGFLRKRIARLPELVENRVLVRGGDARAVVADVDPHEAPGLRQRDLHPAVARVAEFHRVGE